jgi:hypothetical protein
MKLTKKHRIYGGALLACLGILAADRAFFAPASASAGPVVAPQAIAPTMVESSSTAPAAAIDLVGAQAAVARRLDAAGATAALDGRAMPSAFQIPGSWVAAEPQPPAEIKPLADTAPPDPVAEFIAAHRLTAVMAAGERGYAIINGELLYVGQTMGGFTLIEVDHRAAVLASGALRVRLALPD